MKISKINKDRKEFFPEILKLKKYKIGIEIGSFKGEFAKHLLNNWDGSLYLVDIWKKISSKEYDDSSNSDESIYKCIDNLKGLEDRAFMLRMDSLQASRLFRDESIDFIYIDANHKYEYVKQDLISWWPKLKKGGLFAGHDYLEIELASDNKFNFESWPYRASNGIDIKIWDNEGNYNGEFGVNPAIKDFAYYLDIPGFNITNEIFSSWYFFK